MKLKVLSLNIEHGGVLMNELLPFLEQTDADIMIMQEVNSGIPESPPVLRTVQYFNEQLDYPFAAFMPLYRDFDTSEGRSYRGVATFSRYPILHTRNVYYDYPYTETYRDSFDHAKFHPAALMMTELQVNGLDVHIGNIHGPWHLAGEEYIERRGKMVTAMKAETEGRKRVIMAGDINAKPHNPAFERLTHLNSVFGNELKTTFNMKRKHLPGYAESAVDMMWVSPDVAVLQKSCPQVEVSDHLPLIAELEIR